MAMDELDMAFLMPTDAPLWQPLANDEAFRFVGGSHVGSVTPGDSGWSEVAVELERDLVWAEVVAMLEDERRETCR